MRRVGKKIGGRSGATMLFAILVFMLCALTGAAALTAAAANSGRYTHVKEEQQEYLSMSSAVNLMREELVGKTFSAQAKTTNTVTVTKDVAGDTTSETEELEPGSPVYEYDGGFSGQLLNVFTEFFLNKFSSSYPDIANAIRLGFGSSDIYEKELTFTTGDEVIDKYKVKAKFAVDEDFNITVNFSLTVKDASGGDKNIDAYGTDMTIRAAIDGGGISTSSTSSNTSEYDGSTLKSTTTTTITTYTMKVTWLEENTTISEKDTLKTEGA